MIDESWRRRLRTSTDEGSLRKELDEVFGKSISKKIEGLLSLGNVGEEINLLVKMMEFDLASKPALYQDVSKTDYLEDDLFVETEELLNKLIVRRVEQNRRAREIQEGNSL